MIDLKLLEELSLAPGISSFEEGVSNIVKEALEEICDEIRYDGLGSIIGVSCKQNDGPKIMIASHMDEVGFMVRDIDEQGFIRLQPVGSMWTHMLPGESFNVITADGKVLGGIMGSVASHGLPKEVREKTMAMDDLYLDMGVANKEELLALGVRIGDMVTPACEFRRMNNPDYLRCKAFDNRIGVAIGIYVLQALKGKKHAPVYFASTVQEEPGLRGARTATDVTHPDLAFAIDTTLAGDTPLNKNICKLGGGVSLAMIDSNSLAHRGLIRYLEETCKKLDIPFQYSVFKGGGTDSGNIHKSFEGIVNITLSIPIRYMHTNQSIIHIKDVEACVKLLAYIIENMDQATFDSICY